MITYTSLQHPSVKKALIKSMHESIKNEVSHVENKNGMAYIAVRYIECVDGVKRFKFTDSRGENLAVLLTNSYILKNYDKNFAKIFNSRDKLAFNYMLDKNNDWLFKKK